MVNVRVTVLFNGTGTTRECPMNAVPTQRSCLVCKGHTRGLTGQSLAGQATECDQTSGPPSSTFPRYRATRAAQAHWSSCPRHYIRMIVSTCLQTAVQHTTSKPRAHTLRAAQVPSTARGHLPRGGYLALAPATHRSTSPRPLVALWRSNLPWGQRHCT